MEPFLAQLLNAHYNGPGTPGYGRRKPGRAGSKNFRQKKNRIAERDGDFCHYCRAGFSDINIRTAEHLVPRSQGGSNRMANLVLACNKCNGARGHKDYDLFIVENNFPRVV